ncbi:MAG: YihY family inner membrane protein [Hylemonella sp.]|nr:YihY family inner membrane protein [Hylemonella sp.]
MSLSLRLQALLADLSHFPWKTTALTLRERFREDRLGLSASGLTFTTTIALVPLFTVALALFTAFPMFAKFQDVLQKWLVESLVPDNIARQVLGYLTQFAGRAGRLGWAGLTVLFFTALSLVFTIDRTLNAIWRVRRPRPLGQRVLVYWVAITLGPLLLAGSLTITSYIVSASRGMVGGLPGGLRLLLDGIEFLMIAGGLAATYHYVPNTAVKWGHAWTGGIFAAAAIELAKKLLTLYIGMVPTYSAVYGAFATLPILLIWIYVAWAIVLLGAVIAAYLPSLLAGVSRRAVVPGWRFRLSVEMLQALASARRGLTLMQLAEQLHVDPLQLEPLVETLVTLDWVGRLVDDGQDGLPRLVLLAEPARTPLAPLMQTMLLPREASTDSFWGSARLDELKLADALSKR